jgi:putative Mn2+ efflux pump MntP
MNEVLATHILGLDSFAICIGWGSVNKSRWAWLLLALSFAAADAAGTALGGVVGQAYPRLPASIAFIAPIEVATYGCLVLVTAARISAVATSRVGMVLLPPLFGLDNLAAAALGSGGRVTATASSAFIVTAFMALVGCAAGSGLAGRWPTLKQPLACGAALAAALIMGIA